MALGLGNTYDVSVKFLADLESYIQGIEKGSKKIEQFGMRVQKVGKSLTRNLTLPIIALGTVTVNASLKMNKAMSNVATLIPDATERVEELKKEVQDLAVETGKATGEMTEGLYEVISAFGDTEETMARVKANARLAVAGFSSVTEAINFTSAATKGYGDISAEAIQKASDLGLLTVRLGKTSFPALAGSVGRLTGNAKALGITLEELMAIYATLTGVTGDTTRVTTQADAAMRAFMKPIPGMTAAIEKLGFKGSEALIGEMGLVGALRAVLETTDGSVEAVGKLVESTEAFPAIFALAGAQAEVFDSKLMQMNNSLGTTDEAFKAATEGVNKAGHMWDKFKARLQVIAERLGDTLIPAFTKLLDDLLIPFLNKVGEWIKKFTELDPWMQKTILGLIAFVAAIGPAIVGIGQLILSIVTIRNLFFGPAGFAARITLGTTALIALAAAVVMATIKKAAWRKEMRETAEEIDRTMMRTDVFKKKADDLNDTIQEQIDLNVEDAEKFDEVKESVIGLMSKYPGLQTELGITMDDSGALYDANGDLIDSFSELQTLLNGFSTSAIRNQYEAAFLSAVASFKGQLDAYRSFEWVFPGFHTKLEDVEEAYSRIESASRRYVNALREIGELTKPGGALFIEPDGEARDKDKDRDRDGDGVRAKLTEEDQVKLDRWVDRTNEIITAWNLLADKAMESRTRVFEPTLRLPSGVKSPFERDRQIYDAAQEIVSELGYPWTAALYYASNGYTAEDLKALGMVFPGDEGYDISGKGAVVEKKAEDSFTFLTDALLSGVQRMARSIQSGNVFNALKMGFDLLAAQIAHRITAMILKAQMSTAAVEAGGAAAASGNPWLAVAMIGLSFLSNTIFGGDKGRGSDASKPIYTMAFITNWEEYLKFGTTLPTSFVYSGRVSDYNVDPHGRTATGWSTGQHFDA